MALTSGFRCCPGTSQRAEGGGSQGQAQGGESAEEAIEGWTAAFEETEDSAFASSRAEFLAGEE